MKLRNVICLFIVSVAVTVSAENPQQPAGAPEVLPDSVAVWTVDGGAGTAAGGAFSVEASIGQPDAGAHLAFGFALDGGFWGHALDDGGLFRGDFESGGTGEWSNVVGGTP